MSEQAPAPSGFAVSGAPPTNAQYSSLPAYAPDTPDRTGAITVLVISAIAMFFTALVVGTPSLIIAITALGLRDPEAISRRTRVAVVTLAINIAVVIALAVIAVIVMVALLNHSDEGMALIR